MSRRHVDWRHCLSSQYKILPSPLLASQLVDLREKPPEPLAVAPSALGVWELAWPTIVSFATQTAVRWADFAMVGSLGPDALAAVGLGGQVFWLVQSVGALVPTGLVAILARAVGARDEALADASLRQGTTRCLIKRLSV